MKCFCCDDTACPRSAEERLAQLGAAVAKISPKRKTPYVALALTGGIVLLAAAIAAIVWANSAWSETYFGLLEQHLRPRGDLAQTPGQARLVSLGLDGALRRVLGRHVVVRLLSEEVEAQKIALLTLDHQNRFAAAVFEG